jgi:hypothetical protein
MFQARYVVPFMPVIGGLLLTIAMSQKDNPSHHDLVIEILPRHIFNIEEDIFNHVYVM